MNSPTKRLSPIQLSLILTSAIGCVAGVVYVATFGHGPTSAAKLGALAAAWTAIAAVVPIWLERFIFNGGTFQLAVITWRLMTMLGAFVIVPTFPAEARNYFLTSLMACYFIALPLESWLLARNATSR